MRPWITTLTLASCTAERDSPPSLEKASPEQCSAVRRCLRLCILLCLHAWKVFASPFPKHGAPDLSGGAVGEVEEEQGEIKVPSVSLYCHLEGQRLWSIPLLPLAQIKRQRLREGETETARLHKSRCFDLSDVTVGLKLTTFWSKTMCC